MDPWVELERVIGGVSIRRPKLSNRAGEAVRDTTAEADATRWWWRWSGTLRAPASVGVVLAWITLLAFTKATAASGSWRTIYVSLSGSASTRFVVAAPIRGQ